ncbi:MAG: hypothetical protein IJF84_01305 [Thermoguttaceae bacterium]|nr:hypothetical protein [Thermoguttaceae bacterium]
MATIINVHSCADNLLSLDAFIVPEEDKITSNKEENVIIDPVVKEEIGKQLKAHFNG